jgi:hypothetical protein
LGLPTIRAKVMKTEPSVIRDYMGSSSPFWDTKIKKREKESTRENSSDWF